MRRFAALALIGLLAGCASPLPQPRADMAWVDLRAEPGDLFMADRVDNVITRDGRYFQIDAGRHTLETRYEFEVAGGGFGELDDETLMRCTLEIEHDFQPGERYVFVARSMGYQPQGWLLNSERQEVAQARATHCW